MTDADLKALAAKQDTLRLSVQGMKTQQGYQREEIKAQGDILKAHTKLIRLLDIHLLYWQIAFVFVALFYGTIIVGTMIR